MLFDLHPKTELKELFGREKEVQYIREQIISKNWIIIVDKEG
ncbi:MAG: hypothetical protein OWQ54_08855 [Sulfolobaceae archaeon]|nr:hypothetical protein [Sulfolobaceae archaeon]